MKYLLLSVIMSCLAFCSSPTKPTDSQEPPKLVDTNWKLQEFQPIGGKLQAALNEQATLWFTASNSIGGNTGCNAMGGDYQLSGNQLSIQAFSTKMYCAEVATMENTINEIMAEPMTTTMEGKQLVLTRSTGKLIYAPMDKSEKIAATSGGGAAPAQYDEKPSEPNNSTTATQQAASPPAAATMEMTGLFRYLADAAVFQRCSDGQRYGVAIDGAFKSAETYYNRMEKYGAPALMTLKVEVTKNTGEGHPETLIIREVVSSSYEENCPY